MPANFQESRPHAGACVALSLSHADCSWRSQRTALRLVMAETPQEAYETSMRSWLTEPVDSESDDDDDDDDEEDGARAAGGAAAADE